MVIEPPLKTLLNLIETEIFTSTILFGLMMDSLRILKDS